MMWLFLALLASVMLGIQYSFTDQLLETMTPAGLLFVTNVVGVVVFGLLMWSEGSWGQLALAKVGSVKALLALMIVAAVIAELAIITSISEKNASLSAMIEISYPLFTALFAYLLFKQQDLSWGTVLGGVLIMAGVVVMIWANRIHG